MSFCFTVEVISHDILQSIACSVLTFVIFASVNGTNVQKITRNIILNKHCLLVFFNALHLPLELDAIEHIDSFKFS